MVYIPYSLHLGNSALNIFKLALKMLGKNCIQISALNTKVAFHEELSWLCLLPEVKSDAILDIANQVGKSKDDLKALH